MNKKKIILWAILLFAIVIFAVSLLKKKEQTKSIQIGVSLYLENDTFVEKILSAMEEEAARYEAETGIDVLLHVSVANGSQRTQNEQVKRYIQLGYDAVCVNLVDRTSASAIIDFAVSKDRNIPVVFFNREPVKEDIMRRELVYYVGSDAKQSAVLEGEAVINCYKLYPERMDKNGDGILQYVMLEGEMGHQDTIMRSDYSLQTINEGGVKLQKLAGGSADWNKKRATVLMEQWIESFDTDIELVLCNNDDMALGALDALKSAGLQAAVFGIDATEVGMDAVAQGELWATVDCNGTDQGRATLRIAALAAQENDPTEEMRLTDERYYRAPLTLRQSIALAKEKTR